MSYFFASKIKTMEMNFWCRYCQLTRRDCIRNNAIRNKRGVDADIVKRSNAKGLDRMVMSKGWRNGDRRWYYNGFLPNVQREKGPGSHGKMKIMRWNTEAWKQTI